MTRHLLHVFFHVRSDSRTGLIGLNITVFKQSQLSFIMYIYDLALTKIHNRT